jgi:hypothetical protein
MREVDVRRHLPVHLTWLAGLLLAWISVSVMQSTRLGQDSHAYWNAVRGDWQSTLYSIPPAHLDAYNYSPAFAQLLRPVADLPWTVFGCLWSLAATLTFVYLLRPLGWRWVPPLVLCCSPEILSGNVFWVLALVVAVACHKNSRPATAALWSCVALTKLTPALGPVWYAARREWRHLAWSVAGTVAIVAVSAAVGPDLWSRWVAFVLENEDSTGVVGSSAFVPLVARLPIAVILVLWGAVTDRRWTLPLAMAVATPVAGPAAFTLLAAIPRLSASRRTA